MIAFWLPLWSMIDVNNGLLFLIAVFSFFLTITLAVRIQKNNMASCVTLDQRAMAAARMTTIKNPFYIQISEKSLTDDCYKNGIRVSIYSDYDFWISYYWGVNINEFHKSMALPSETLKSAIFEGSVFNKNFIYSKETQLLTDNDKKDYHIQCTEDVNAESLGKSPRAVYPLVIILLVNTDLHDFTDNETILNVNVLHIKDETCPLETNIVSKLIKLKNGITMNIQNLFVPQDQNQESNFTSCVICQENLVAVALLPCRHTCVCYECFSKIDKCPLCRSFITTFFEIKPDIKKETETSDMGEQAQNEGSPETSSHNSNSLFSKMTRKINKWFHI